MPTHCQALATLPPSLPSSVLARICHAPPPRHQKLPLGLGNPTRQPRRASHCCHSGVSTVCGACRPDPVKDPPRGHFHAGQGKRGRGVAVRGQQKRTFEACESAKAEAPRKVRVLDPWPRQAALPRQTLRKVAWFPQISEAASGCGVPQSPGPRRPFRTPSCASSASVCMHSCVLHAAKPVNSDAVCAVVSPRASGPPCVCGCRTPRPPPAPLTAGPLGRVASPL